MDIRQWSGRLPFYVAFKSVETGKNVVMPADKILYVEKIKNSNYCHVYYINVAGAMECVKTRGSSAGIGGQLPCFMKVLGRGIEVNGLYLTAYTKYDAEIWTPNGKITFAHDNRIRDIYEIEDM